MPVLSRRQNIEAAGGGSYGIKAMFAPGKERF